MKSFINQSRLFIITALILASGIVFGQGESNIWYFGAKAGLNFNGGGPTLLTNGALDNSGVEGEGCSAISDAAGNLLFYTDGKTVYTRTHTIMPNGSGDLLGDKSSTQSAVILPVPGSTTRYYLFTAPVTNSNNRTRYSIVNMTLNSGLGDVEVANKNVIMPSCPTFMMEALTSVPSDIAGESWIISHAAANQGSSNSTQAYYAWKVTTAGISAPVISNVGYALPSVLVSAAWVSQGQGFIKSNTCYTKLFTSQFAQSTNGAVEMHNFDKATGIVSGPTVQITNFDNRNEIYSIEISPNDKYLYVSELGQGTMLAPGDERVHQFDVSSGVAATINASRVTLMTSAPTAAQTGLSADFVRTGHLQLAPDGKIYVSHHSFSGTIGQLSVINTPNALACGFQHYPAALRYPAGIGTTHGLPQFPRNFVAGVLNITGTPSACLNSVPTVSVPLSYTFSGSASSVVWSTTGGGTFSPSTTNNSPSVTYTTAGTKTVTLQLTDICSNIYTETYTIVVSPQVNSAGSIICGTPLKGTVTSPNGAYSYAWYSDAAATDVIGVGTTNVPLLVSGTSGNVYLKAVSTASSTPATNTLRNTGTMNTWTSTSGTVVAFTVSSAITLNSFEWGNGTIPGWPYPATTYTVMLQNAAGSTTYLTRSHTTASGSSAYNNYPETGLGLTLTPGNYKFVFNTDAEVWSASTNASDANVSITSNPGGIGNFNYTVTNYSTTPLVCSQTATIPYSCSLPVTWLNFEASRSGQGSAVVLEWSTATEENSRRYHVQRSVDGVHFETIAYINAAGNSSVIRSYEYLDQSAPQGDVYYRIVEEDLDGLMITSAVKEVNGIGAANISLVPNPGNGNFKIIGLPGDTKLMVSILSVTGQSIFTTTTYPGELVDLTGFAKGFYVVQVLSGTSIQSIRFINQ